MGASWGLLTCKTLIDGSHVIMVINFHAWKILQNLRFQGIDSSLIHQPFSHQGRDHKNSQVHIRIQHHQILKKFPLLSLLILHPSSFKFHVLILNLSTFQKTKWKMNVKSKQRQRNRNKVSQYCTSFVISTLLLFILPQHEIRNWNS